MDALNAARRRGLTLHIGVANFPVRLIREAVALSDAPLVANQCEYHPYLEQSRVLAACRQHGLAFMAYSPLRQARSSSPLADATIMRIARNKGVTPAQIVLRWHFQQKSVISLPRSSSEQRIGQNIAIAGFHLTQAEISEIAALSRLDGRKVNPAHAPDWD